MATIIASLTNSSLSNRRMARFILVACCYCLCGTTCTTYVVQLELDRTAGTPVMPEITLAEPDIEDVKFETVPLRARSNDGPSMLAVPGQGASVGNLFLTWSGRGNDRRMWFMRKSGFGPWLPRQRVNSVDRSDLSPSLAKFDDKLFIAWTGTDSEHHVNVMESNDDGASWTNKGTFRDEPRRARSNDAPYLVAIKDSLFLVWSGRGSDRRMFIMENEGEGWLPKRRINSEDSSDHTPSLAYFNERFYLAWTDRGNERHINVMDSRTGYVWSNKRTFTTEPTRARSDDGPKLEVIGDKLYLVFSGRGAERRVFTMRTEDGTNWAPKIRHTASSDFSPAIAMHADRVYLAWTDRSGERFIHATEKTKPVDLAQIYAADGEVRLNIDATQTGLPRPPPNTSLPCNDALDPWELRDFEQQFRTTQREPSTRLLTFGNFSWRTITNYSYGFVVDRNVLFMGACEGVGGIMYSAVTDDGARTAFAVTKFAYSENNVSYLQAVAHELGHTFNLHHTDGLADRFLMCGGLSSQSLLSFSSSSKNHLRDAPRNCARPGPNSFESVAQGHLTLSTSICGPHLVDYLCE